MAGKQDVVNALQSANATCDAGLNALKNLDRTVSPPQEQDNKSATLDTLLSDFSSLLTLLYQSTTKLSIALKPSSPTYAAALTPLKDLRTNVDALASCGCSIEPARFGTAIAREARWAAEDVINSLQQLFAVFLHNASSSGTNAKSYLARTGAVHEAIDRARGVSRSNREAVQKRWTSDMGSLEDCVNEVLEMTEDRVEEGEGDDDDGWDELDIDGSLKGDAPKPTEDEIERLNSAHMLFKSILLLFEAISARLLSNSAKVDVKLQAQLDSLLVSSGALLAASDELVSALDIPHDIPAINEACLTVLRNVLDLRTFLAAHGLASASAVGKADVDQLVNKAASLSIGDMPELGHSPKETNLELDVYFLDVFRWGDATNVANGS